MTRIILALSLVAITLGSTASAFAANNAPNCSSEPTADLGKCVFLQSQRQQN